MKRKKSGGAKRQTLTQRLDSIEDQALRIVADHVKVKHDHLKRMGNILSLVERLQGEHERWRKYGVPDYTPALSNQRTSLEQLQNQMNTFNKMLNLALQDIERLKVAHDSLSKLLAAPNPVLEFLLANASMNITPKGSRDGKTQESGQR